MKRILLVDDHPILREGLRRLVSAESGLSVCGVAGSVQEALSLVESEGPDLIVTDLTLPGRNGLELIKDLVSLHPTLPILVLSMHDEMAYAERVLRAGGRGYVMKDTPPEELLQAIATVLGGGVFVSKNVNNHLLQALSSGKRQPQPSFPMERLTDREMEIFELIGRVKSNHEIACQLGISPRTVDAHRSHIREKLGIADSNELTRQAIRWIEVGMISP